MLSAFSNLIANAYTTTKGEKQSNSEHGSLLKIGLIVKQAIAWQRFIPFYRFFGRQDRQFDSPGGALVLHWIFSVVEICLTKSGSDAYAFTIGIFSYGYEILMGAYVELKKVVQS